MNDEYTSDAQSLERLIASLIEFEFFQLRLLSIFSGETTMKPILVLLTLFSILITAVPAPAAEFISLGTLPGYEYSQAYGVSDDGMVVAGWSLVTSPEYVFQSYRWTNATGMVGLGYLPGGNVSVSGSVGHQILSRDGSTIVGASKLLTNSVQFWQEAFIYTEAEGMRGLGGTSTSALGVSNDGSVVIGDIRHFEPNYSRFEVFRWTDENGLVGLGFLPGDTGSHVGDITGDGSIIVGSSNYEMRDMDGNILDRTDWEVFTWTESTGMVGTGIQSPAYYPLSITDDGSMISGSTNDSPEEYPEAFYWTEETGKVGLGWLPGTEGENGETNSQVRDMTPDGRLIVGRSGMGSEGVRPFIWSEEGGMVDFQQSLIDDYGLGEALEGWNLGSVQSVSSNGQFFAGWSNPSLSPTGKTAAWLVRLDAPWGTTVVPEPSSILLALMSIMTLARSRHNMFRATKR